MYRPTWIDHLMPLLPAQVTPRFDEVPPSAPLTSEILYTCDGLRPTTLPPKSSFDIMAYHNNLGIMKTLVRSRVKLGFGVFFYISAPIDNLLL